MNGKITKINSGNYYINYNNNFPVRPRGIFRYRNTIPLVGDNVEYEPNGFIMEILPRKNQLTRPKVSNIDQVAIVASLKEPMFSSFLLNKMLLTIENLSITPLIIFTKTDLSNESWLQEYTSQNYNAIEISNKTKKNINTAKKMFEGKLTVFMGQTGAGKTSTLNSLFNRTLATQEISKALGRGKHTTRIVEMYKIYNSEVIDTPGFSSFDHDVALEDIPRAFRDFRKYSVDCKFRNCKHNKEINCEIKRQVRMSNISQNRYKDYLKLLQESEKCKIKK